MRGTMDQLLKSPLVNASVTPTSKGGPTVVAKNADQFTKHHGDPSHVTADFTPEKTRLPEDRLRPAVARVRRCEGRNLLAHFGPARRRCGHGDGPSFRLSRHQTEERKSLRRSATCHPEHSEGSCARQATFFASLRMTFYCTNLNSPPELRAICFISPAAKRS